MRKILGIDPGKDGGLSIVDEQFNLIASMPMPVILGVKKGKKIKKVVKLRVDPRPVYEFISHYKPELAIVELVGAMPGQGVSSMFSFGDSYGVVRSLAEALCAQVIYARPQDWKRFQGLSGLSKDQVAEVAYEVFGEEQIYGKPYKRNGQVKRKTCDGISDSLMIAKYGVRFLE